ncbi:MAG: uracil-DNA glycosylase [Rhodospirillales bacterium]|nr:uracil-DNA glycosylase [Rhodospirillales bacterium]
MATPSADCRLCPRLAAFRDDNRHAHPEWHNAPVPSFGADDALLLVVGLAPGLRGANRTGRPFTGDHAGELLFATLLSHGLAEGSYGRAADDGLRLTRCRISNAVRCVPPANRPTPEEIRTCNPFLRAEIAALPRLRVIVALGLVAHQAVLAALELPRRAFPFAHGALHTLSSGRLLADSYHCSRQNTNTGRLTPAMFDAVFAAAQAALPA